MARNTYVLVPTNKSDVPRGKMLKVRNHGRRNPARLNKRLTRLGRHVVLVEDNGTLIAVPEEFVETFTVKREAERAARRTGRRMVTLPG